MTVTEDPKALGRQAGTIYGATIDKLVAALQQNPGVPDAWQAVNAIIADAETQLVELGRTREAMDAGGRSAFDRGVMLQMSEVPYETFEVFSELQRSYQNLDTKLGTRIASANIVTQFANFDLLRQQSPEAAARHGVA